MSQPYCPKCQRFLPDRYVEGTCPYCRFPGARGDQCDQCGKPLNPAELIDPRCRTCGTPPEFRESEHFFLKLTAFQDRLLEWVKQQTHWRPECPQLHPELSGRRAEGPGHNPGYRLGSAGAGGWL